MNDSKITCPNCNRPFELTSAIEAPIVERIRAKYETERKNDAAKLEDERRKLALEREAIKDLQENADAKVKELLAKERERIAAEQQKKAREQVSLDMEDLKNQIQEKDTKLKTSQKAELDLRQKARELEAAKAEFDLEMQRQKDALKEAIAAQKDDEYRLRQLEQSNLIEDLKRQLDEMRRKADQGSQQAQGEALELDLEAKLRDCFEADEIAPIAKGVHGGDLLQNVRSSAGHVCGAILWELKHTKAFGRDWIDKLKNDALAAKAQAAVLVSTALPKEIGCIDQIEGVWVCLPRYALPVAALLRHALLETSAARRAMAGRHDKIEVLYDYMTGSEFKGRVVAIIESFKQMKTDLDDEKRAIQKLWAKREKQIERVLANTSSLWGELQGIAGNALPGIDQLELPSPTDAS